MKLPNPSLQSQLRLVACLLCAAVTLALLASTAAGQDFDAVERRLADAVGEGELSLEQAARMMEALEDGGEDEEGEHEGEEAWHKLEEWIDAVAHKIESAVEEGEIDEATAHEKWRYFLDKQVGPKLKAAVKAGMLDQEEALEFWKELSEQEEDHEQGKADENIESRLKAWVAEVGGELKEAVAAGKLDEVTARKKWLHFKEQELVPKLKAAVKSGAVDEKFAIALWKALEKAEAHEKEDIDKTEVDWEAAKRRIEGAVKAGKLTREQANQAYEKLKKSAQP
ncbi:MAG: hypothetical protein O3C40_21025 [Planctomycetota bacterium]|nr:hypothetical protein [Planctomycetota bacterium]